MNAPLNQQDGDGIESKVTKIVAATLGKSRVSDRDGSLSALHDRLDSYALLELVLRLEETFEIQIEDDELDPDYFESIATISAFIASKHEQAT